MQNTLLVIIIMLFTLQPPEPETFKTVTVLELFTSQGCSSCPKADALLGAAKANDSDVIALSYHVDYWNYIGWKDPFSSKYNTEKQREYGEKFYANRIYTPQLVINGEEHFVGSNAEILKRKLKYYKAQVSGNEVILSDLKKADEMVSFNYAVKGSTKNKSIRFVLVIDERSTEIKRGENKNRTIKNENIVVNEAIKPITNTNGKASIKIPEIVNSRDSLRLVAIIQSKGLSITGATQLAL